MALGGRKSDRWAVNLRAGSRRATRALSAPDRWPRRHARAAARALVVALLASGPGSRAAAQVASAGATGSGPSGGTVAGVVFDSLHAGPLVGAQIAVDGTTRLTTTDSSGRFRLDSLAPGVVRLAVFHPVLDSVGTGLSTPPIRVAAGDTIRVALGVPSPATLRALFCRTPPGPADSGTGPSLLVGRVLDAETEEPVGGGRVALSWTEIQADRVQGLKHIDRARDTLAGPAGVFRFCWLPGNVTGTLHVARTTRSEVLDRPFAMNNRYVAFVALHLPGAGAGTSQGSAAGTSTAGTSPARATLTGRVVREEGGALVGAVVRVLGSGDSAVTADSGRFVLRGEPTGSRTLFVRAVGYQPVSVPVELSAREPRQVAVVIGPKTAVLQKVLVTAELKAGYQRVGFDRRQAGGLGRYLTAEDIARRNPSEMRDLLVGMPGLVTRSTRNGRLYTAPSLRSTCLVYMVDGHQFREMSAGDIDAYVRPNEIAAVEVYQSGEAPSEVVVGPGSRCAAVIIWTKTHLGIH